MTAFFPLRQLRKAVNQIGSAVNASQEYSRAASDGSFHQQETRNVSQDWARYIPL